MAVIVPSFFAPILTQLRVAEPGPEALKTSSRSIIIFTGRPDFFDKINATGSRYTVVLPPNPPPISLAMTFSRFRLRLKSLAVLARTSKCP